jgi:hypothetical protein
MDLPAASQFGTRETDLFLPGLPAEQILAAYAKAPEREDANGGLDSPRSSAALAANAFGFFWNRPLDLPPLPRLEDIEWPATSIRVEQTARFPWNGGTHPWLDVLVQTAGHLVGVEVKRYEHVSSVTTKEFSEAYRRPVWGNSMGPFERMRDELKPGRYKHLNAYN